MRALFRPALMVALVPALLAGCQDAAALKHAEDEAIRANLARLDPADRQLAEAQKFCAVETENRLGSMGVPYKLMVKDQPVFLCCKGCRRQALADPDKTLARVEELRARPVEPASR